MFIIYSLLLLEDGCAGRFNLQERVVGHGMFTIPFWSVATRAGAAPSLIRPKWVSGLLARLTIAALAATSSLSLTRLV